MEVGAPGWKDTFICAKLFIFNLKFDICKGIICVKFFHQFLQFFGFWFLCFSRDIYSNISWKFLSERITEGIDLRTINKNDGLLIEGNCFSLNIIFWIWAWNERLPRILTWYLKERKLQSLTQSARYNWSPFKRITKYKDLVFLYKYFWRQHWRIREAFIAQLFPFLFSFIFYDFSTDKSYRCEKSIILVLKGSGTLLFQQKRVGHSLGKQKNHPLNLHVS